MTNLVFLQNSILNKHTHTQGGKISIYEHFKKKFLGDQFHELQIQNQHSLFLFKKTLIQISQCLELN